MQEYLFSLIMPMKSQISLIRVDSKLTPQSDNTTASHLQTDGMVYSNFQEYDTKQAVTYGSQRDLYTSCLHIGVKVHDSTGSSTFDPVCTRYPTASYL